MYISLYLHSKFSNIFRKWLYKIYPEKKLSENDSTDAYTTHLQQHTAKHTDTHTHDFMNAIANDVCV